MRPRVSSVGLAGVAVLLAGCTTTIDLRYRPAGPVTDVPGADALKVAVVPVEDRSGGVRLSGNTNSNVVKLVLPRPLAEGVREALEAELQRLGFSAAASPAQADVVARAVLTAVGIDVKSAPNVSAQTDADFMLDLKLERVDRVSSWSGGMRGRASTVRKMGYDHNQFGPLLNEALARALGQLGPLLVSRQAVARLSAPAAVSPAAAAAPAPRVAPKLAPSFADVDELPASRAKPRVDAFAVVIGVGRYRRDLPAADFADRDAKIFSRYLGGALGYPDANVVTLVNDEAGKADFEKYLERWLPNHAQAGSEVLVYFSGHGAPNPKTGDAYLVPYDGDPVYLEETAYPLKRMYAQLAKLPASRVTVVLDSCFSGAGGRSVIARGARPLISVTSAEIPAKLTVLSAAAGDQISHAYPDKGHGLFTYFLLKGLKEKGGLSEAFEYLKPEVAGYARRELNSDQTPQWQGQR